MVTGNIALKVGKLYRITKENGWRHAVLDLNPNDELSSPINIIQPGDIFLIIEMDFWEPGDHNTFYEDHMCLNILYEDITGWIIVLPLDIEPVSI
jgi:hypothetical protein